MKMISKAATILEFNLISAQQLIPKSRFRKSAKIQTYVVAYMNIDGGGQKLFSRIDEIGNENPTWNDKFVFMVDRDSELIKPTSCIVFEIYKVQKRSTLLFKKNKKIGEVRVLLEDLLKQGTGGGSRSSINFMAFHVCSKCDDITQGDGILNIGVVVNSDSDGVFKQTISRFLASSSTTTTGFDYRKLMTGLAC